MTEYLRDNDRAEYEALMHDAAFYPNGAPVPSHLQAQRAKRLLDDAVNARRQWADWETWTALRNAGFPAYKAPEDEPLADWRTPAEKRRDLARELADRAGMQDALFPLDQYEPTEATLKDLREYAEQQREITERFAAHDEKRFAYLERLVEVAGGDESMTWAAAAALLPDDADGLA